MIAKHWIQLVKQPKQDDLEQGKVAVGKQSATTQRHVIMNMFIRYQQ